jgi:hypothetical protein
VGDYHNFTYKSTCISEYTGLEDSRKYKLTEMEMGEMFNHKVFCLIQNPKVFFENVLKYLEYSYPGLKSKKGLFRIKSYYFNNHMQT